MRSSTFRTISAALYPCTALTLKRFGYFVHATGIGYPRAHELRCHFHMKLHAQMSVVLAIDYKRLIRA